LLPKDPVDVEAGKTTQTRYFTEGATTPLTTTEIVTSGDGHTVIEGFVLGTDVIDFSGLTQQKFDDHFVVDTAHDVTGDSVADTHITLDTDPSFDLVLSGVVVDTSSHDWYHV
jgi:hypothetical protein